MYVKLYMRTDILKLCLFLQIVFMYFILAVTGKTSSVNNRGILLISNHIKNRFFFENRHYCEKLNFLSKIEISVKNRNYCQK